jgi:AraC family transcriptional regulator of adaptative response/methylated-DNA-[protein]-cysteine methyltransferase
MTDDDCWRAIVTRDPSAEGFYYAVTTTGIFCRPSCGARLPRRDHVRFFTSTQDAAAAGFRACKRCRPTEETLSRRNAIMVAKACRAIEMAEEAPDLAALAEQAGLSRFHFHRVFKAVTGVTPKDYSHAHRVLRMRNALVGEGTVTKAIYDAGFGSSSRFHEATIPALGMTPTRFRKGGDKETIRFAVGACSLGAILVAATEKGIAEISLDDDPEILVRGLQDRFPNAELSGGDKDFERMVACVVGFVEQPALGLDLPLDIRGTAFQHRVWQTLRSIPPGSTVSYSEVARRIGSPASSRAVARACAANRLAVAIPCHRVIRNEGGLSGYRWGIDRKRALLDRESRLVKS